MNSSTQKPTVVTMPGDGIGPIVLQQAQRVLDAVGFDADYVHAEIGWRCWVEQGQALPDRTVELLRRHKLGLLGAVTSKGKTDAEAELAPELRGTGKSYFSPILGLRQTFDLDICMRPCRSFLGNPLNFVRREADGRVVEPHIDTVIFRQNTEDLYVGVEWTAPPSQVRDALNSHEKFRPFRETPLEDLAVGTRIFTRRACRRIVTAAFRHAQAHGIDAVTLCEKPNVLRETSGMMEQEAQRVAEDFPGIELRSNNIDAQLMWMTKDPERQRVLVAGNMFGDLLSDAYAGLVGGLGFAASANLGREVAIFEPSHGSAPRYAQLQPSIVNPVAMILTAAMMLDHLGQHDRATGIRDAVDRVVQAGTHRTYDMLRLSGGPEVLRAGAASTEQMTDAVIQELNGSS